MRSAPRSRDQVFNCLGVERGADATVGGVSLTPCLVLPGLQAAKSILGFYSARTFMRSVIANETRVGLLLFDGAECISGPSGRAW